MIASVWMMLKQPWCVLIFWAVVAYLWGIVSIQHYMPTTTGFLVSAYGVTLLAMGMPYFFIKNKVSHISVATLLWLALSVLLLLQPVFHRVVYMDDLLLSFLAIILCALWSWAIALLDEHHKHKAVICLAWAILLAGILTALSQMAQLLRWDFLYGILIFDVDSNRLTGNIAQPNQAACVLAMSVAAMIYLLYEYKQSLIAHKWYVLLLAHLVVLLTTFGMALTISRGGILLFICVFIGSALLYKHNMQNRLFALLGFAPAGVVGYWVGSKEIQSFNDSSMSAVGRLVGETESLGLRQALLEQAWLAFQSSPVVGIGWNGMISFGLQNAERLSWFTTAHHVHNIIAQMGAELGMLGILVLLGFIGLIIKNFRFDLPYYKAFALVILGLLFAYSLSEYPLWYFRFLLLAVFFMAIIDGSQKRISIDYSKILTTLALGFVMGGVYYIYQYHHYATVYYLTQSDEISHEQKIAGYQSLPNVFGYSKYKELILYILNPVSGENLDGQIALGERVLSDFSGNSLMNKQAMLLMNADRTEEVDKLLRASCIFTTEDKSKHGQYCPLTVEFLEGMIEQDKRYQGYLDRLAVWYEQYYQKPLPTVDKNSG